MILVAGKMFSRLAWTPPLPPWRRSGLLWTFQRLCEIGGSTRKAYCIRVCLERPLAPWLHTAVDKYVKI
jgi:hypothetical protein